jgi:hypothetical protein
MYFIKKWLHWLLCTIMAVVGERLLLGDLLTFALATLITMLLFLTLTGALYGEWRSVHSAGVTYILRDRE